MGFTADRVGMCVKAQTAAHHEYAFTTEAGGVRMLDGGRRDVLLSA